MTNLGHLWEETDGERQSQAEGGEAHQSVDGQDEPPLSLQEREPGRTQTKQKHCHFMANVKTSTKLHCNHYITFYVTT